MKYYCIQNVRIIDSEQDFMGSVLIFGGKIKIVFSGKEKISLPKGTEVIEGRGKILLPGLFDPHVHFRDPGLTQKEDLSSGSRAAVSGGVTSFLDMPNTVPPTLTVAELEKKRLLAREKSCANFGFFMGANETNAEEIKKAKNIPGVKLYLNPTTGNLRLNTEESWRKIFRLGRKVVLHAEGETFLRAVKIWEEEKFPCELHLAHVSRSCEIEAIRKLKRGKAAKKISCEVTPHHLLLSPKEASINPEIGSSKDREALWEGVLDGTIDFLATDHAPHTAEEKRKGAFGIPGVETFFSVMFTEFVKRKISLTKFAKMTSRRAFEIFHVQDKKGKIQKGFDADLILVDPQEEWSIDAKKFFSKCHETPFDGKKVTGRIEKTFAEGELVFENGEIILPGFRGRELGFE